VQPILEHLGRPGTAAVGGAPPGCDGLILGRLAQARTAPILFVARDDVRMARTADVLRFFAPEVETLSFPAWDCIPFDRVSPRAEIVGRRMETLARLTAREADTAASGPPAPVVLTTVAAVLQRLPPKEGLAAAVRTLGRGERLVPDELLAFLASHGYVRAESVRERGDFAVRGGIVDVFPPGLELPVRLDFFGDELDAIRSFDPGTQRSIGTVAGVTLKPVSEVFLEPPAIARFRSGYRARFGAMASGDPLYEAVSAARRHAGMEHWLPLFYDRLDTVFAYLPAAAVILDDGFEPVCEARLDQIAEHFATRKSLEAGKIANLAETYRPVAPQEMFLSAEDWARALEDRPVARLSPFTADDTLAGARGAVFDLGGRPGLDFADARQRQDLNLYTAVAGRIDELRATGRKVLLTAVSEGSRDRLSHLLRDHGLKGIAPVGSWAEALAAMPHSVPFAVLPLDHGFAFERVTVICEPDILGERMSRRPARRARAENFLTEASALSTGDLVVHVDHGIGRYEGLEAISADGAPHDCLRIVYAGEDKLYLPVENIEVISRYGSDSETAVLDRLGGAAWQSRKARLKERIREIAHELIGVAAERSMRDAPAFAAPEGVFDEFCARFPFAETDDQARAIADVLGDLAAGRPTDRLICGDVGFGKTEVAMRAAFVAALDGRQVAVVVPTTLLSRQHFATFSQRFSGFPIRIGELSRLVTPKQAQATKKELASGTLDIVIGTHALLARDVKFRDLGLVVVDEEQHFGVAHKERLKRLKTDVHVLTLTATPIPRTLQLALGGVKEMSLIATPPVDRLAVRTFVTEFDPVVIREAILRERHRGGQTFYVCPRIEHLEEVGNLLKELVPEVSFVTAHGRLQARALEAAVGAFYEGRHDVLLSTNIIESGLDLPSVNTIVIHRSDLFGLSQLYQLRGRVGRGKLRAYAYLTLPAKRRLTAAAERRLSTMQALDALGAGFTLASHDLDIRGAGNLLGDEQSGHIREVGIELYQQMLEEAVAEARGVEGEHRADAWSPQLALGLSVLIPENYVPDLGIRLGLYRRLADVRTAADLDGFAVELVDRFGPVPEQVKNLLDVVAVKQMCRRAGVERVEVGPKGAVIGFRAQEIRNPEKLVAFIARRSHVCKLRPDQRLVYRQLWETPADRLAGVRSLIGELARLAEGGTRPS
jgi:transcription-repair coupling factor (superfamily II helicase)